MRQSTRIRTHTRWLTLAAVAALPLWMAVPPAAADALGRDLHHRRADGSEVNFNSTPAKKTSIWTAAPAPTCPRRGRAFWTTARYVFQVTNPTGKTLLSTMRRNVWSVRRWRGVHHHQRRPLGRRAHDTGSRRRPRRPDRAAPAVQRHPNPGGEYKVWVTATDGLPRLLQGDLASINGLHLVDPGESPPNHGFVPDDGSKTDNFKVGGAPSSRSTPASSLLGNPATGSTGLRSHTPTPSAPRTPSGPTTHPRTRCSTRPTSRPSKRGTHYITIANQPGCTVGHVMRDGLTLPKTGPQTVSVTVHNNTKSETLRVDVECK